MSRPTFAWMRVGLATLVVGLATLPAALAQEAALRDRVRQLVERLDTGTPDQQQAAEKALVDLGPRVLPVLPEPSTLKSLTAAARLERVRATLENVDPEAVGSPSLITIQAQGIRLSEALQSLQKQSGNSISDLREMMNQDADNPALDLDLQKVPFFEALDTIATAANLTPYFYTDDGSVGLMARAVRPATGATPDPRIIVSGPLRVELKEIQLRRLFDTGTADANARVEFAWEPRLRPMLLTLRAPGIQVKDDQDRTVEPRLGDESLTIPLDVSNPIAELNLNLAAPERTARQLASLKVDAQMTLPAGVRTFRFEDLSRPEDKQQGQVTVSLVSTTVEDFAWKVRVLVGVPGQLEQLDSYQQALINNRIWLQRADGSRFEHNGGFSDLGAAEGKVGFEYIFVDAPGKPSDYALVYETPSEVVQLPVSFEFTEVPLP